MIQDSRQAGATIEITDAMIEAGVDALELHEPNQPRIFLEAAVRDILERTVGRRSHQPLRYETDIG